MGIVKRTARHGEAVVRGMLFIGFTIQMLLGVGWLCCNFGCVQDFGEPESALYRGIFRLLWENPRLMYSLQLGVAVGAGYRLLRKLRLGAAFACRLREPRSERAFAAWGSLALLTFPFALQCHLAVLPHSLTGSLFLLMLSFLVEKPDKCAVGQKAPEAAPDSRVFGASRMPGGRVFRRVLPAVACAGLALLLSGAADADRRRDMPEYSFQSALASRMAWPDIWNDRYYWPEDLREMTEDVLWEVSYYPGNMVFLMEAVEGRVGAEAAKGYYMQIARTGWERHSYMVVRQIGWDVLGYVVTPLVVPLQLQGEAYDSFTGRNYEVMRGNAPVLTRYYVDYGCWWFGGCLALALCLFLIRLPVAGAGGLRKCLWPACICAAASAVLACVLTMRGAGLMDYKYTAAVNELWLMAALLPMGSGNGRGAGTPGEDIS